MNSILELVNMMQLRLKTISEREGKIHFLIRFVGIFISFKRDATTWVNREDEAGSPIARFFVRLIYVATEFSFLSTSILNIDHEIVLIADLSADSSQILNDFIQWGVSWSGDYF